MEVILPAADYRERSVKADDARRFDDIIRRAASVKTMPYKESGRTAYEAANEALLSSSDLLFAVWDGLSPADRGGTATVVESARSRGMPIEIIWPDGAARR